MRKKNILAICDEEEDYVAHVMEYLSRRRSLSFEIHAFTSSEKLCDFAGRSQIRLLLISEELYQESMQEWRDVKIIRMGEKRGREGESYLCKYQPARELVREVLACYEGGRGDCLCPVSQGEMRVIGVCDLGGGLGASAFAIGGGAVLADSHPALYLNMGVCTGLTGLWEEENSLSVSDLIYFQRQGSKSILSQLCGMVRRVQALECLPPILLPEDMEDVRAEDWKRLIGAIGETGLYDVLVIQGGPSNPGWMEVFAGCTDRFLVEEEDALSRRRSEEFLHNLPEETAGEVRRLSLPRPLPAGAEADFWDRVTLGSFREWLEELLADEEITEIMINGPDQIFCERGGKLERTELCFADEDRLLDVIRRIVGACNRVVNEQAPIVDARLPDGKSRIHVVLPPVALNGPTMTIRRFPREAITMEALVRGGALGQDAADFLRDLVEAKYSILIGGGTSTGKTTFLNALSGCIPREERIITIEDNAELQLQNLEHVVRLEEKRANLEESSHISIRDLIRAALRMRPSRILIGEVRGAEAGDFLTCLNTGHEGSLGTAHANSTADMIGRLETMVLMGTSLPVEVIRRQIAAGVEILVHLARGSDGQRRVEEISEILGMEGDEVKLSVLYRRTYESRQGELLAVGSLARREKLRRLYESRDKNRL